MELKQKMTQDLHGIKLSLPPPPTSSVSSCYQQTWETLGMNFSSCNSLLGQSALQFLITLQTALAFFSHTPLRIAYSRSVLLHFMKDYTLTDTQLSAEETWFHLPPNDII